MTSETVGDIVADLHNKACLSWIRRRIKRDEELRTLADRIEAARKKEFAELKGRLDAIVECAKRSRWPLDRIHHRLHNANMKKIIDLAKGASK